MSRALLPALALLVIAAFVASLCIGPADADPLVSLAALILDDGTPLTLVMREIRLPRALLGVLVGASLGLSGAAMQGYLRNPLAEPGLLGVTGGAALGAVLALQTGLAAAATLALPVAALTGAAISGAILLLLAGPRSSSLTLILAGVALSALTGALTSLVLNLSPNPFAAQEIVFWTLGSLADRSMAHVWIALPFMVFGWALILPRGRALDALTLGEDTARSLGFPLTRTKIALVVGTAAAVGAATAVAGAIGFVGLVVPHLLRRVTGARPSALLPASMLGGAALVLVADIAVRLILPARDLKLGVLMAIVGAPLFLHLIYRTRRDSE